MCAGLGFFAVQQLVYWVCYVMTPMSSMENFYTYLCRDVLPGVTADGGVTRWLQFMGIYVG